MKYVVTSSYEVDVPEKGSDKWNLITKLWQEHDPEQWTGDNGRWEPSAQDMAQYMTTLYTTGGYDVEVEIIDIKVGKPIHIPAHWTLPASWTDPEHGADHSNKE
jgi:hypothetical protein